MKVKRLSLRLLVVVLTFAMIAGIVFTSCSMSGARSAVPEEATEKAKFIGEYPVEATEAEPAADMAAGEFVTEETEEEAVMELEPVASTTAQYGDIEVTGNRKVIKNAYIEIEIEKGKFQETMFALTNLAEQNGGFVASSESYSDSEGNLTSGRITIRVPSKSFSPALNKIKEMGTVKNISSYGQDVTQEYIDLESRLRNYEAQEKVLLELMKQSKKVSDSIEVQRELSNVQGEIEIIKGRMRYLDDMVSFSTIDVYFHEPEPISSASGLGFIEALKRGARGAIRVFNSIVVALIASSPVWIIIVIIAIIIWQVTKAKRRRAGKEQK
jgi:hypothetical protein